MTPHWPQASVPTVIDCAGHEAEIERLADRVSQLEPDLASARAVADRLRAAWESASRSARSAVLAEDLQRRRADRLQAELDRLAGPAPEWFPLVGTPLKPEPLAHQLDAARRRITALEERLAAAEGRPVQAALKEG